MRIRVTIGDNENKDYRKEVEAEISSIDWLVYKDCFEYCTYEEYVKAFDNICDDIQAQNNLPYDWYIDGKIKEV